MTPSLLLTQLSGLHPCSDPLLRSTLLSTNLITICPQALCNRTSTASVNFDSFCPCNRPDNQLPLQSSIIITLPNTSEKRKTTTKENMTLFDCYVYYAILFLIFNNGTSDQAIYTVTENRKGSYELHRVCLRNVSLLSIYRSESQILEDKLLRPVWAQNCLSE